MYTKTRILPIPYKQVIQRLAREVHQLHLSPPDGVTFVANEEESLMELLFDVEGPVGTPYEGACVLRVCGVWVMGLGSGGWVAGLSQQQWCCAVSVT